MYILQVADIGEVSYILNPIQTAYEDLNMSNAGTIDYYGPWQSAWWSQADYLTNAIQSGTNGWDDRSKMHAYWKIANYLFTGMLCLSTNSFRIGLCLAYHDEARLAVGMLRS